MQAESELAAGIAPHIHPFADLRDLAGLLQRTGYTESVSDSDIIPVSYKTMRLLHDLRGMGEANILLARHKAGLRRDVLARALQIFRKALPQITVKPVPNLRFAICQVAPDKPLRHPEKPPALI